MRIDFLCKAKTGIKGFTSGVFGIEAKYPLGWMDNGKSPWARGCQWLGQMVQYRHSRFWSGKDQASTILPVFVLSAPPLSDVDGHLADIQQAIRHIGIGELNFRPRRHYDPAKDILGRDYEVVLEIRFQQDAAYWRNTRGRTTVRLGKDILDIVALFEEEACAAS